MIANKLANKSCWILSEVIQFAEESWHKVSLYIKFYAGFPIQKASSHHKGMVNCLKLILTVG